MNQPRWTVFAMSMHNVSNHTYVEPVELFPELSLTILSCVLSILGSFVVFWTFYRFDDRNVRTGGRTLLVWLCIADLVTATGNLIGVARYIYLYHTLHKRVIFEEDNTADCQYPGLLDVCIVQSFMTTCSSMMSFFWTCAISIYFIAAVVGRNNRLADRLVVHFHVFCWSVPLFITSFAAGKHALGEDFSVASGGWCWITRCNKLSPGDQIAWMAMSGKVWEILMYLVIAHNYILVKYHVWSTKRVQLRRIPHYLLDSSDTHDRNQVINSSDTMFVFVPFVMYLLRIWGTIRFIVNSSISIDQQRSHEYVTANRILTTLQGIGDSGQGFGNFLLFCLFTKDIRKRLFCRETPDSERRHLLNNGEDELHSAA
ncbi:G-protein coupled receptor 157-like [Tubulanus polymorphus]|uniref:G-protein coupled receptor 157-like n=1 Tax=Tubulanus polymorphus TaxID=672921 RepID=UPI003DA29DE6